MPIELSLNCKSHSSDKTAVAILATDDNPIKDNSLGWRQSENKEEVNDNTGSHANVTEHNSLNYMARAATANSDKTTNNILFSSTDKAYELADDENDSFIISSTLQCPNCNANCSSEDSHCPNCDQDLLNMCRESRN